MSDIVELVKFLGQFSEPVGVVHGVMDGEARRVFVNSAAADVLGCVHADEDVAPRFARVDRRRIGALCLLTRTDVGQAAGPLTLRVASLALGRRIEVWITATASFELGVTAATGIPRFEASDLDSLATLVRFDAVESVTRRDPTTTGQTEQSTEDSSRTQPNLLACLNRTEMAVLRHTITGDRVQTISSRLFLSEHTVRNSLKRINRKLGTHSTAELREKLGTGFTLSGTSTHRVLQASPSFSSRRSLV